MNPGTVLIRADANVSIGTGHVMRCLALAQAWQDRGGAVHWISSELPDALACRLKSEAISHTDGAGLPGSTEDAATTVARAHQIGARWVVVDGERFESEFLGHIHDHGLHLLLVDDFADRQVLPVSLIVNPNSGVKAETYRERAGSETVLAGPKYCLLRREFRTLRPRSGSEGKRVLISLGGSDPENLTPRVAVALAGCDGLRLTLVAGPANPATDCLRQLSAPNVEILFDVKNMAEVIADSDIAVIAAGGTLWELLAMGCVVLSYARNALQKNVVESLASGGMIVDMGDTVRFEPDALRSEVARLAASRSARERMAEAGRKLVDGAGAMRVIDAMLQYGAD